MISFQLLLVSRPTTFFQPKFQTQVTRRAQERETVNSRGPAEDSRQLLIVVEKI
jgi:hypothetical protein